MADPRDMHQVAQQCLMAGVQAAKRGDDPGRIINSRSSSLHPGSTREELRAKVARDVEWETLTGRSATFAQGVVSIVFRHMHSGEPGIGVETYDHRTGESLALFQPGRKTWVSPWKLTGPVQHLGHAEKLPRHLRGKVKSFELTMGPEENVRLMRAVDALNIPHLHGMGSRGILVVVQADQASKVLEIPGWPAA